MLEMNDLLVNALAAAAGASVAFAYTFILVAVVFRGHSGAEGSNVIALSAVSAGITLALGYFSGDQLVLLSIAPVVSLLVVAWLIDAKTKTIPNTLVVHALVAAVVIGVAHLVVSDDIGPAVSVIGWSGVAAAATFIGMLNIALLGRGGLGMGDVKLGSVLAFIACVTVTSGLPAEAVTSVATLLLLVTLIVYCWLTLAFAAAFVYVFISGIAGTKRQFPFGPFLIAAFFIVIAIAQPLTAVTLATIS